MPKVKKDGTSGRKGKRNGCRERLVTADVHVCNAEACSAPIEDFRHWGYLEIKILCHLLPPVGASSMLCFLATP